MRASPRLEVTFTADDHRRLLRSAVSAGFLASDDGGAFVDTLEPGEEPVVRDLSSGASLKLVGAHTAELSLPSLDLDPRRLVERLSGVDFAVATFGPTRAWVGYPPPALRNGTTPVGYAVAFRGHGHTRAISRRWLERGPWRVLRGPRDTTLLQLHDAAADEATSLEQARSAHALLADPDQGVLPLADDFQGGSVTIQGKYLPPERRIAVDATGRAISRAEMFGAAAARTYQLLGAMLPIENVVYRFEDPAELSASLPELWLYGLEARLAVGDGWERKDGAFAPPKVTKPGWVTELGGDDPAAGDSAR